MVRTIGTMNTNDGGHVRRLAEWTDRIRAGELPASVPPRPHGVERNVVVTVYDWLSPKYYIHDLTVTDRRKPTVNAFGLIYGAAELSTDHLPILDPVKVTKTTMKVPIRDQDAPSSALANPVVAPSPYFGTEQVWDSRVNAHNPMMDQDGRVYYTAQIRSPKNPPAYCAAASGHPSAKRYPLTGTPDGFVQNSRQVTVYDPKTRQFTFIDTCFGTHHLNFAEDANNTLWLSNNLQNELALVGWVNTKMFWETRDAGSRRAGHRSSSTPTATASATPTSSPTSRKIPPRTSGSGSASTASRTARLTVPSGGRTSATPATSSAYSRDRIHRRPRWRKSTRSRRPDTECAGSTSTARAWRG